MHIIEEVHMGREVRMVPPDWNHPKMPDGTYRPLYEGDGNAELARWCKEHEQWLAGSHPDQITDPPGTAGLSFSQWHGRPPDPDDYMPVFAPGTATHFCMYEDTSEGTPISPAFATPQDLARWLADSKASACGCTTATYEQWLSTIECGYAPSLIVNQKTGVVSGVVGLAQAADEKQRAKEIPPKTVGVYK